MQIFHDYRQLKEAQNQLANLKLQRGSGQVDLKTFYKQKKALETTIAQYHDAKKPVLNIHQEYTLKELLEFTFYEMQIADTTSCFIENLRLFTKGCLEHTPQADTVIILDVFNDVHEEGYTQYVLDNNLELAYNGELFVDVVSSYQDYKTEFDVKLLIKALAYYSENDNFMEIE